MSRMKNVPHSLIDDVSDLKNILISVAADYQ